MNAQERSELLARFDEELLKGSVVLSEWCVFIVNGADMAFVAVCHLPAILAAASGVETYLRSEYGGDAKARFTTLIDQSDLPSDLKKDLHSLRRYRNRWVHLKSPSDEEAVVTDRA